MLYAQIGLARIEPLFGTLFDPLVAIAAKTATLPAAARPGLLPAAAKLTRTVFATSHEEPRSLRSLAQYSSRLLISRSKPRSGGL